MKAEVWEATYGGQLLTCGMAETLLALVILPCSSVMELTSSKRTRSLLVSPERKIGELYVQCTEHDHEYSCIPVTVYHTLNDNNTNDILCPQGSCYLKVPLM